MKLGHQDEIYAQADIRGEIWRQALHKLNRFYRQQTKATAKDLEEAINEACRKVTPTLGPCFLQRTSDYMQLIRQMTNRVARFMFTVSLRLMSTQFFNIPR